MHDADTHLSLGRDLLLDSLLRGLVEFQVNLLGRGALVLLVHGGIDQRLVERDGAKLVKWGMGGEVVDHSGCYEVMVGVQLVKGDDEKVLRSLISASAFGFCLIP